MQTNTQNINIATGQNATLETPNFTIEVDGETGIVRLTPRGIDLNGRTIETEEPQSGNAGPYIIAYDSDENTDEWLGLEVVPTRQPAETPAD